MTVDTNYFNLCYRLLREFKIEWKYGPLDYRNSIVNFPTNDLKFAFIDLK